MEARQRKPGGSKANTAANGNAISTAASATTTPSTNADTTHPAPPTHTKYKHAFPVHTNPRASPLSLSDTTSPPSFFGFRNLMGLVLVASNLRLMIENFRKYGILVTLSGSQVREGDWWWFGVLYLLTPGFLLGAFGIERLAAGFAVARRGRQDGIKAEDKGTAGEVRRRHAVFSTWRVIAFCHGLNATTMLVIATYVVYYRVHNPGTSLKKSKRRQDMKQPH